MSSFVPRFTAHPRAILAAALLFVFGSPASADVVTDWNAAIGSTIETLASPDLSPLGEARTYAMAHLAMFDAIRRAPTTGANDAARPDDGAVAEAAAATAAHDVLLVVLPAGAPQFDTLLARQLDAVRDHAARPLAIALGHDAAKQVLRARGFFDSASLGEKTAHLTSAPFVLKRSSQFRVSEPNELTFAGARFRGNGFGDHLQHLRTDEREAAARRWAGSPVAAWNRIAATLADHFGGLRDHARLFAALNTAVADATLAALDSRSYFRTPRPVERLFDPIIGHQINPDEPFLLTQELRPIPNYPSLRAAIAGAGAAVLAWYGRGDAQPVAAGPAGTTGADRKIFDRISDAAKEHAIIGLLGGEDSLAACIAGFDQGRDVGDYSVKRGPFAGPR